MTSSFSLIPWDKPKAFNIEPPGQPLSSAGWGLSLS